MTTDAFSTAAGSSLRRPTTRGLSLIAVRGMLVRIVGPASSFLMVMVLARTLGATDSGAFFVALTLVTAVSILAKVGLETALQRFVGSASGVGDLSAVLGIYRQALRLASALSILAAAVTVSAASPIARFWLNEPDLVDAVRALGALILPYSLLGIHAAMLKALHRPIWGGFFEAAAWPLLTLALFGPTLYTGSGSTTQAALAFLLAALLASGWAWGMVYRMLPRGDRCRPLPARRLLDSCVPLTLVEIANFALLWAPFILLPIVTDSAEAGRYNLAHRFAAQLGLIMLVVAAITAPRFAAHFARDEAGELRRLVGRSTRVLILLGAPAGALLLAWDETLLGWFGDDFVDANHALQMLVIGQLINLATGPAGYLLAMTGHERALRNTLLVTLALMLPSAWMLITAFGANGAAAAVAGAMLFQNLICNRLVVKRLGLPFFLAFAR